MKKILFALSSPLIRNNGIVTFIRETTAILRAEGHQIDFITDAEGEIDLRSYFDNYFRDSSSHNYQSMIKDGIPDVVEIPEMSNRIQELYSSISRAINYDIIISNDAQCTNALYHSGKCVHYVHTAGLLPGKDYSFLNDSYIQFERYVMYKAKYVAVQSDNVAKLIGGSYNFITLGLTLENIDQYLKQSSDSSNGILFVGEGTKRKGADKYETVLGHLKGVTAKLMVTGTLEVDFKSLENVDMQTFASSDHSQKAEFIRGCQLQYFPSKGEVMPYGVLEALLSIPVIVDEGYAWHTNVTELGAIPTNDFTVEPTIRNMLRDNVYDPHLIIDYFKNSKQQWINFLK